MKSFEAVSRLGTQSIAFIAVPALFLMGLPGCGGSSEPAKVAVPSKPAELKPGETGMGKVELPKTTGKAKKKK